MQRALTAFDASLTTLSGQVSGLLGEEDGTVSFGNRGIVLQEQSSIYVPAGTGYLDIATEADVLTFTVDKLEAGSALVVETSFQVSSGAAGTGTDTTISAYLNDSVTADLAYTAGRDASYVRICHRFEFTGLAAERHTIRITAAATNSRLWEGGCSFAILRELRA
jgi:hypothetical protein